MEMAVQYDTLTILQPCGGQRRIVDQEIIWRGHLLARPKPREFSRRAGVVIATDQELVSDKLVENRQHLFLPPKEEIPQVIHQIIRLHPLVPASDHLAVHLIDTREWPLAVADDVGVVIVRIGGEVDQFMRSDSPNSGEGISTTPIFG